MQMMLLFLHHMTFHETFFFRSDFISSYDSVIIKVLCVQLFTYGEKHKISIGMSKSADDMIRFFFTLWKFPLS